jgi:hypothetical protein
VILKPTPAPVSITPEARTFNAVSEVQSHDPEEKRRRQVKTKKKRPINTRFRPGLVFTANGRRYEAVLPILLEPVSINNTQWLKVVGSQSYTLT